MLARVKFLGQFAIWRIQGLWWRARK